VARLLVAERSLFAAERGDRIVLAATPQTALHGLCVDAPPPVQSTGVDLDVSISRDAAGREAQGLFALLGMGPTPRLSLAVRGHSLAPLGIASELAVGDRLASAPLPDSMLRAVPEDAGVVLTLALDLPTDLTPAALEAHLAGRSSATRTARQALVLWNPRGARSAEAEVALLWSRPEDEGALKSLFSARGQVHSRRACGLPAISSSEAFLDRMDRACSGGAPSILASPAPVVSGLRAAASVGLGVNVGRVLSRLVEDAWRSDPERPDVGSAGAAPAEIDDARRLLEELPFMGFSGTARERSLVPGGYRS